MANLLRAARNERGRLNHFGYCRRCGDTWDWKEHHVTKVNPVYGVFSLCEECWQALTPQGRVPYYRDLFDSWEEPSYPWCTIEKAVLNESTLSAGHGAQGEPATGPDSPYETPGRQFTSVPALHRRAFTVANAVAAACLTAVGVLVLAPPLQPLEGLSGSALLVLASLLLVSERRMQRGNL